MEPETLKNPAVFFSLPCYDAFCVSLCRCGAHRVRNSAEVVITAEVQREQPQTEPVTCDDEEQL